MFDTVLKDKIFAIAEQNKLEPAALLAVVWVESAGRMSARVDGRDEPLIRFEGHYFHRLLPQGKRNRAVVEGLAHSRAGRIANPLRQSARWKLLRRAEAIDRRAALSSCSWGCGQVMGAHWNWLGYPDVHQLVDEARSGPSGQVRLMVRFVQKAGLSEKLKQHDWAGFARAYNGPSYRRNRYDSKLRGAYRRFVTEPGTGDPLVNSNASSRVYELKFGSCGEQVRKLQRNLTSLGYMLIVDGDFGPATQRMVRLFQAENGLGVDGVFGSKSFETMQTLLPVTV